MASDGGYNSVDLTWSQCSRARLQNFFSTGKADCVTDLPLLEGSLQDWKPGLYYGVDDQCRIAFGSSAKACSFRDNDMVICRVLSCHTVPGDQSTCTRLLVPLLDVPSTCSHHALGHVEGVSSIGKGNVIIPGNGGVQRVPRPVFGGRPCEGQNIEAEICGSQHCGNTQLDFMAEQCSHTDPLPLYTSPSRASHHSWMPSVGYIKGDMQCKFMCLSKGEDFIVSRGSQFVDGTRCEPDHSVTPGSISACLEGRCQVRVFGCDGVLNSGKVADVCGVCGGDGSTCHLTSLSYHGGESREYITFLTLPVNATQIHVINRKPVFTHLAVLVEDRYVVSGTGSIALNTTHPSPLEDGHMTYHLYLTTDQLPDKEELVIPGPVQEKTHIQVCSSRVENIWRRSSVSQHPDRCLW
uniref:Uncharacterized protein n=1 Tax=Denticeps clupeoides TaxID=299321 RepID=A0AAY4EV48_9TELE